MTEPDRKHVDNLRRQIAANPEGYAAARLSYLAKSKRLQNDLAPMKVICCVCKKFLRGNENGTRISHGLCAPCAEKRYGA